MVIMKKHLKDINLQVKNHNNKSSVSKRRRLLYPFKRLKYYLLAVRSVLLYGSSSKHKKN
jgi:hypothetical protein